MPEATRSPAEWWLELVHASRRLHEMHFDDIPDLPAELIPDSIECEELGHQIDSLSTGWTITATSRPTCTRASWPPLHRH